MSSIKSLFLAGLMGFATLASAYSHPHVFIDVAFDIVIKDGTVQGVHHHWTFSEEDTAFLILNLDANGDGIYQAEELQPLAEENANALTELNYYSDMVMDEAVLTPGLPEQASMVYDNGRLTLSFFLPLLEAQKPKTSFLVDIYDPEVFIAFGVKEAEPFKLQGAIEGCALSYEIGKTPEMDVFSDEYLAGLQNGDFALQFSKKAELKCA